MTKLIGVSSAGQHLSLSSHIGTSSMIDYFGTAITSTWSEAYIGT